MGGPDTSNGTRPWVRMVLFLKGTVQLPRSGLTGIRLGPDPESRVKSLTPPHWMTTGEHGGTLSVMWNSMTW
jgi:hypothetical protein